MLKNLLTFTKNRNKLSIMLSFFILALVMLISITDILYFLDKKVQNSYYSIYNSWNNSSLVSDEIIVIEIDDKTLEAGTKLGRFPFDRKDYIPVIENLNSKGAAVIGFDIIFSEKTNSDNVFAKALKKAGNVVIGGYINVNPEDKNNKIFVESIFNKEAKYTGFLEPKLDKYNHVVYSLFPYINLGANKLYDHFSMSILKVYYSIMYDKDFINTPKKSNNSFYYVTPNKKIPYARSGEKEVLINFVPEEKFIKKGKVISFIDVYDKEKFNELSHFVDFKDKIVLIGASASGIKDIFYTPNGNEPGVYVHVNMINTVLSNNYIKYIDKYLDLFILYLLIIISVYFNLSRSGYILILSNIAIISIFSCIFPTIIFSTAFSSGVLLVPNYFVEYLLALILSLAISNIVKYMVENKHKTKLNKALSEYVSKNIAKEILSGEGKVNLDGENKKISIFFSDIEGFTSISEKFEPEELVSFLREYLGEMSDIIMDEDGFINKYEGDAIMALWGAFGGNSDDSYKMCVSALKQQEMLQKLNVIWAERGFSEIKVRIGMHYGNAILGNIGSEGRKIEFTALGDSVNLASRLEGVNKFYGTYVCVSENVYNIEKGNFEFRYLDRIKVKGKEKSVNIYELMGYKGKISEKQVKIRDKFELAVDLYIAREFEKAKESFKELIKLGDNASKLYLDMCELYIKTPPALDWDGVSTMTSK